MNTWYNLSKQASQSRMTLTLPLDENQINQFHLLNPNEFILTDSIGGSCQIVLKNQIPSIIRIHSVPENTPTDQQHFFKQRGFFKSCISALKILGFNSFNVILQSEDSQRALARMFDTNHITNPRDFTGDSMSTRPTTFDISPAPQRPIADKWEQQNHKHWMDYKKEYLQKSIKQQASQSTFIERWDGPTKGRAIVEVIKDPSLSDIAEIANQQDYGDEVGAIVTNTSSFIFRRDLEFHKNVAHQLHLGEFIGLLLSRTMPIIKRRPQLTDESKSNKIRLIIKNIASG